MEKTSPSEVVDKAVRLLRPDLECRGIQLHRCSDSRLSEIMFDSEKLKKVLANLLINGYQAMDNLNGSFFIHEREEDNSSFGRAAVIEISDNGSGIGDAIQAKIFEPPFTTKKEGTGLGLCIARQIVVAHGGRLAFLSSEKEGSASMITLPYGDRSKPCLPFQ